MINPVSALRGMLAKERLVGLKKKRLLPKTGVQ